MLIDPKSGAKAAARFERVMIIAVAEPLTSVGKSSAQNRNKNGPWAETNTAITQVLTRAFAVTIVSF